MENRKNNTPCNTLSLIDFKMSVVDDNFPVGEVDNCQSGRTAYGYDDDLTQILTTFTLVNNLQFDELPRGQRGSLTVRLHSVASRSVVAQTKVDFNFTKKASLERRASTEIMAALAIDSPTAKRGRSYRVTVTDDRTSTVLLDRQLQLVDLEYCSTFPENFFEAKVAYLLEGGACCSSNPYRDYTPDEKSPMVQVVFELNAAEFASPNDWMELEIILFGPGGSVQRVFARLKDSAMFIDKYHGNAENPCMVRGAFYLDPTNQGVYYAELRCLNGQVSGFCFSTTQTTEGYWGEMALDRVWNPTPQRVVEAYASAVELQSKVDDDTPSKKNDFSFDDDYDPFDDRDDNSFERALDKFISDELAATAESASEDDDDEDDDDEDDDDDDDEDCTDSDDAAGEAPVIAEAKKLERLVGLGNVKAKLESYMAVQRFNKRRCEAGLPANELPLHAMFLGSPGTGKTTVAKIFGRLLKEAGVLTRGHVVVRERSTLLGQNYNSESENTLNALEEAQGGILFIDEAYQLHQPHDPKDPGKFVIETLLTAMSDPDKRDWMLILSGYTKEMLKMLKLNPGFKSRIPESNIYVFDDFNSGELVEIADRYLADHHYEMDAEARKAFIEKVEAESATRDDAFGNGRYIVNMIETEILPSMAIRTKEMESPDVAALSTIVLADIPRGETHRVIAESPKRQIGFNV